MVSHQISGWCLWAPCPGMPLKFPRHVMKNMGKQIMNMKTKKKGETKIFLGANLELESCSSLYRCSIRVRFCQYQAAEMSYQPCSPGSPGWFGCPKFDPYSDIVSMTRHVRMCKTCTQWREKLAMINQASLILCDMLESHIWLMRKSEFWPTPKLQTQKPCRNFQVSAEDQEVGPKFKAWHGSKIRFREKSQESSCRFSYVKKNCCLQKKHICGFPKVGVPPKHPFKWDFPL